jgi:hypothetical protein
MTPRHSRPFTIRIEGGPSLPHNGYGGLTQRAKEECERLGVDVRIWDNEEERFTHRYRCGEDRLIELYKYNKDGDEYQDRRGQKQRRLCANLRTQKPRPARDTYHEEYAKSRAARLPLHEQLGVDLRSANETVNALIGAAMPKKILIPFVAGQAAGFCIGHGVSPKEFMEAFTVAHRDILAVEGVDTFIASIKQKQRKT